MPGHVDDRLHRVTCAKHACLLGECDFDPCPLLGEPGLADPKRPVATAPERLAHRLAVSGRRARTVTAALGVDLAGTVRRSSALRRSIARCRALRRRIVRGGAGPVSDRASDTPIVMSRGPTRLRARQRELWPNLGDGGLSKAAYRGG